MPSPHLEDDFNRVTLLSIQHRLSQLSRDSGEAKALPES